VSCSSSLAEAPSDAEKRSLLLMLAGYVHVVMVFHASIDNLRYFVPVVPSWRSSSCARSRAVDRKWLVAVVPWRPTP